MHDIICLGHTFTDNSPGWFRMKMVRMMPENGYPSVTTVLHCSTVKNGLIRFRYGKYRVHVGKKNGSLRFVTVYYGLNGSDT